MKLEIEREDQELEEVTGTQIPMQQHVDELAAAAEATVVIDVDGANSLPPALLCAPTSGADVDADRDQNSHHDTN